MRRVFILGGTFGHVTRRAGHLFKVKRSNVKVTRSRAVSADKNAITRQRIIILVLVLVLLAVLDPRVGHTMDVLSPFIPVLYHSD